MGLRGGLLMAPGKVVVVVIGGGSGRWKGVDGRVDGWVRQGIRKDGAAWVETMLWSATRGVAGGKKWDTVHGECVVLGGVGRKRGETAEKSEEGAQAAQSKKRDTAKRIEKAEGCVLDSSGVPGPGYPSALYRGLEHLYTFHARECIFSYSLALFVLYSCLLSAYWLPHSRTASTIDT